MSSGEEVLITPERVITYVLEDLLPRKNADFPLVRVASTSSASDHIPSRKSTLKQMALEVLEIGTSSVFYTSRQSLKEAKAATRQYLSQLGYTVHSSGPRRVYVLEYAASFRPNSDEVWLYVGETGNSVEHRMEQHLSGVKAARGWKHLSHRRPDLEPNAEYWSFEDSTEAEQACGLSLSLRGFRVCGPAGFSPATGLPDKHRAD